MVILMIDQTVKSYQQYLEVKHPALFSQYNSRLCRQPEGARAEAVVHSALRQVCDSVTIAEDPSHGGPDFLCALAGSSFVTEVTAVAPDVVKDRSSFAPCDAGSFSFITHTLRNRISDKSPQLAHETMPRVLVIASEHAGSNILLGPRAAEYLMAGDLNISIPFDGQGKEPSQATQLSDSAFFRFNKTSGDVESCRRSVSAVLLVSIYDGTCGVVGVLHPDPAVVFVQDLLPNVPYLSLRHWPVQNRSVEMEWTTYPPDPMVMSVS